MGAMVFENSIHLLHGGLLFRVVSEPLNEAYHHPVWGWMRVAAGETAAPIRIMNLGNGKTAFQRSLSISQVHLRPVR